MKAPRETTLVRACLELLQLRRVPCWRANTGAVAIGSGAARRFVRFGPPGQSDIIAVLPPTGRLLALECKSAAGRLRPAQKEFLDAVAGAGGASLVVRDVRQLAEALDGLLADPPAGCVTPLL